MNSDEEWETDEEKTEYLRLSIEKSKKIKNILNKTKLYHTKIIKRLEKKEIESAKNLNNFINKEIVTKSKVLIEKASNKLYLSFDENDFVIQNNPEIGTNIILEQTNNNNLKVLGVAERYFEATVFKPKRRITTKHKEITSLYSKNNFIPSSNNSVQNSVHSNADKTFLGKKKRRRPKRNYKKDSTIIEVRKRIK